ncbi:Fibronectin type III, partial [Trinorchestia longiramus]
LSSCTYYTVTVQPQKIKLPSQVDTGTPASDSTYTLPGDVPISNVICPSSNNLSITLTWGGPGECVQYSVSYNATVLWEYQEYLHDSLTTRHMTATFTDLVPYTRYVFTVGAEEIDGEASCNSTTPE